MTDVASNQFVRQGPRRRTDGVQISDFTMLVRVKGNPSAVRVFTEDEEAEARSYAAEMGGIVVPLPD